MSELNSMVTKMIGFVINPKSPLVGIIVSFDNGYSKTDTSILV